jgi:hypothetical protein
MTTGALIFAFNNEYIDYLAMARWTAANILRHLDIPTAIVTDKQFEPKEYEQCIFAKPEGSYSRKFADQDKSVTWYNGNRVNAYELTPWEQTLVIDADYVVASDQLKTLLAMPHTFAAHKTAYDVVNQDNFDELNNFGNFNMPMWWATVMMFRKDSEVALLFIVMCMIKENWQHYRNLYKISKSTYRNDFALSIALGIVNGHGLDHTYIPWKLASVTPAHTLKKLEIDSYQVDFLTSDQKSRYITISNQDFHAMGKKHLGDIVASDIV